MLLSHKLRLLRFFILALLGKLLLSRVIVVVIMVNFLHRMQSVIMISGTCARVYWLLILEAHLLVAILNRRLDWCDVIIFIVVNSIFVVVTTVRISVVVLWLIFDRNMILIPKLKMHLLVTILGARLGTCDIIICIVVESTFVEMAAQSISMMVIILVNILILGMRLLQKLMRIIVVLIILSLQILRNWAVEVFWLLLFISIKPKVIVDRCVSADK